MKNNSDDVGFNTANLLGHIGSGNAYLFLAFYWTITLSIRYQDAKALRQPFTSSLWYPASKLWIFSDYHVVLLQAMAAIIFAFIPWQGQHLAFSLSMDNQQHVIIASAFLLHGAVVFAQTKNVWLPPSADYFTYLLANLITLHVFLNHLDGENGHSQVKVKLHLLVAILMAIISFLVALEMAYRNVTLALIRCYVHLLLGTWYWQVAFVAFSPFPAIPRWVAHSHESIMMVVFAFVVHCLCDLILIYAVSSVTYYLRQRWGGTAQKKSGLYSSDTEELLAHSI